MSEFERWEARFAGPEYHFGTEPNAFLKSKADLLKPGQKALSIADGEGRNGVFLAEQGLDVLAMDFSPTALAKSQALARQRGVTIRTEQADLDTWRWPAGAFDVVVAIFFQFCAPPLRTRVFDSIKRALKPGGLLLMEGYTPQAAPVQDRRPVRGREPLHAQTAGTVVCGFLLGRDQRVRQRNP